MTSIDASYVNGAEAPPARRGLNFTIGGFLNVCVLMLMASSSVIIIEPAPYEFFFLLAFGVFLYNGVRVPVLLVPLLVLAVFYAIGGLLALLPFFGDKTSVQFTVVSIYLLVTTIFFATYVTEDTDRRVRLIFNGYVVAAVIGGTAGIVGYFDIGGTGEIFTLHGRGAGTTKDPNVLGAYMVPPTVYLMLRFVQGGKTAGPLTIFLLGLCTLAILVSFSRGAWANFAGTMGLTLVLVFLTTTSNALKWRILILGTLSILLLAVVLSIALSFDGIREAFLDRFTLVKSYDAGVTGRFGRQIRAIPMLLDAPNGFGPLQFSTVVPETEPHQTFINAFANYGWIGGIAFLALMVSTWFIGWRLVFISTPWQPLSIVVWSATVMITVQSLQIDIDHWRHFFLLIGLTWGLFAASHRYQRTARSHH